MTMRTVSGLETKFQRFGPEVDACEAGQIAGYASLFNETDQGGDTVQAGAYSECLSSMTAHGRSVKMLWQHDPARPIGVWDEIREDDRGLYVRGRLLTDVQQGAEALALMKAGAIDGLSIGYRTLRSVAGDTGRVLQTIELWEVSLVTFPMLPGARAATGAATEQSDALRALTDAFAEARSGLA